MAAKANKVKAGLHSTPDTATPYNRWSTSGIAKKDKEFLKCLAKKHSEFKMSKITQAADVWMQLYTYKHESWYLCHNVSTAQTKEEFFKKKPMTQKVEGRKMFFSSSKEDSSFVFWEYVFTIRLHYHDNSTRPSTPANIVHIANFFSSLPVRQ